MTILFFDFIIRCLFCYNYRMICCCYFSRLCYFDRGFFTTAFLFKTAFICFSLLEPRVCRKQPLDGLHTHHPTQNPLVGLHRVLLLSSLEKECGRRLYFLGYAKLATTWTSGFNILVHEHLFGKKRSVSND